MGIQWKESMNSNNKLLRSDKEFCKIVNTIKAKYLLAGKTPPSTSKITQIIARNVDRKKLEEVLRREFIRF